MRHLWRPGMKALLHIMSLFPIGSYVVLNDGSVARVLRRSGRAYGKPIVQVVTRPNGTKASEDDENAIFDLATTKELHVVQALPTPGENQIALRPDILNVERRPVSSPNVD